MCYGLPAHHARLPQFLNTGKSFAFAIIQHDASCCEENGSTGAYTKQFMAVRDPLPGLPEFKKLLRVIAKAMQFIDKNRVNLHIVSINLKNYFSGIYRYIFVSGIKILIDK